MEINNLNHLSQAQVAALLLVDQRSVRNFGKEDPPIPSWGKGRDLYYVWDEVLEWWYRRKFRNLYAAAQAREGEPEVLNGDHERALLYRAQRIAKELDNARSLRETLSIQDYQQALAEMITPAKNELLALEAKLRAEIGPEHAGRVGQEIRRALRSLGGGEALETPA